MSTLAGRTAVVTGAAGGFGLVLSKKLAEAGAELLLVVRTSDQTSTIQRHIPAPAVPIHFVVIDLTSPDAATIIAAQASALMGGVDVLLNNAAIQGPVGHAWETTSADWALTIQVNLLAAVDLCRRCIPLMPKSAGRGKIINMSGGGATSPRPRFSAYSTAKTALVRFSETLAEETKDLRIDVNAVAPGMMNTAMTRQLLAAGVELAGDREYSAAIKLAEAGSHHEIRAADLCLFLASSASDGISGKLLSAVWDPWESLADHAAELMASDVYTLRRIVPEDRPEPGPANEFRPRSPVDRNIEAGSTR